MILWARGLRGPPLLLSDSQSVSPLFKVGWAVSLQWQMEEKETNNLKDSRTVVGNYAPINYWLMEGEHNLKKEKSTYHFSRLSPRRKQLQDHSLVFLHILCQ